MASASAFGCFLIGEGSLPVRCGEILLAKGHRVLGAVCADAALRAWAEAQRIPTIGAADDVRGFLSQRPFDYLFSVVNYRVLDADVLALPRRLAVNYHDGPLPRYAGSHATSWALLEGEATHGVTWHVMTSVVDGGPVLQQRPVEISPSDTALSLNAKCFEAAALSFDELVDGLASGRVEPREQDAALRRFVPLHERPPAQALIRWQDCARNIDALVRGLDFGAYPNPLGLPKAIVGDEVLVVRRLRVTDRRSGAPAGTVTAIDDGSVTVATGTDDVALEELGALDGEARPLPELVRRHGLEPGVALERLDPDVRERISRTNRAICRHERYWVGRLRTLQPAVLPSHGRPAAGRSPSRRRLETIPVAVPEGFAGAGGRRDVVGVLAAFTAFVARLTTTYRFDVGFRSRELAAELAGLPPVFAAAVPVTVELRPDATLAGHEQRLREEVDSLRRRRTYARDALLRYPALGGVAAREFRTPLTVMEGRSADVIGDEIDSDVVLLVATEPLACAWVYDAAVFDPAEAADLAARFGRVLEQAARSRDQTVSRLSLLGEDEHRRLVFDLNDTGDPYPESACLHGLFEAQARRTPDAVAVWHASGALTYRELDGRANRLAHHLQASGVGVETLVGISLPRAPSLIVALLAVLKAGGAYVPLDPRYPRERVRFMLADSGARVVVTEQALVSLLPAGQAAVVALDRDWPRTVGDDERAPASAVTSTNLAYVLYTSGSTGTPKGVAIEHRNVAALLHWAHTTFSGHELSGVLASTSVCFDLSVFEIFVPLTSGGRVVLVDDALALASVPRGAEVTLVNTVPSAIAELLRTDSGLPDSVVTVNLAGEPLSPALVDALYELGHVRSVYDLYGPSEDTTYSTCALRSPGGPATIGRPIANTRAYVLDAHGDPAPFGAPGELHLGGAGVARGYLDRPELTGARFIPDRFCDDPSARLYRTGDLVQYLPDGSLRFLGRLDNQVKVRGYRIELGEIEAALRRHPRIRDVVVDATTEANAADAADAADGARGAPSRQLVAYLAEEEGYTLTAGQLRRFLAESLPDFMVPSAFVRLERIPRTPNGKVDRQSLPPVDGSRLATGSPHVVPQSDLERTIAEVWEEALERRPVGTRDNFFDLGGDSLTLLHVGEALSKRLLRPVSLVQLYSHPTVEALARAILVDASAEAAGATVEQGTSRGRARRLSLERRRAAAGRPSDPNARTSRQ